MLLLPGTITSGLFNGSHPHSIPSPATMPSPNDTNTQVMLIGLIASGIAAVFAWRSRSGFGRLVMALVALCLLAPSAIIFVGQNPWLIDARSRTFQTTYWYIRIGMGRDEILAEIRSLYPPNGERKPPIILEDSATSMQIQMNPEESSQPSREIITLKMQDGRVMGKKITSN